MHKALIRASIGAAALFAVTGTVAAQELRFMTGPQGGIWVPLGGALKDLWEKNIPGLKVAALPGAGVVNVRGIEENKADIGFGNTITTVDAVAGNAPFPKPHASVCNLATLYPQYFQVIVLASSGINSVTDFKGKTITTLPRGNTTEAANMHMLKAHGLTYNDLKVTFGSITDSVTQMQDGQAQVWSVATGIPAAGVMDLSAGREVKLIDLGATVEGMKKINPGYSLGIIPAGTYPKQTTEIKVPTFGAHIVVHCKQPEDLVYKMTKAIAENVAQIALVHKGMAKLTVAEMGVDVGVPMHAGALKYYKEKGISTK